MCVTADAYGATAAAASAASEMVIMEVVDVVSINSSSLLVHKIRWNSYISVINDALLELLLYSNTREECHVK